MKGYKWHNSFWTNGTSQIDKSTNGTSHFGQTAQVRLTKVQMAQVKANVFFFMNGN